MPDLLVQLSRCLLLPAICVYTKVSIMSRSRFVIRCAEKKNNETVLSSMIAAVAHSSSESESDSDSASDSGSDPDSLQGLDHIDETDLHAEMPLAEQQVADAATSSPVVVHVPSICACGCVVIGVWYCKVAHYCEWFRHPRYRVLRSQLELKRRMSNGVFFSSCHSPKIPETHLQDRLSHELDPARSQPSLGPEMLTLLCAFQLLRHKDALFIRELCWSDKYLKKNNTVPSSAEVKDRKPQQLAQSTHVNETSKGIDIPSLLRTSSSIATSVRTHIDSVKSQSFVHFRWCAHIPQLYSPFGSADQSSTGPFKLSVVGCSDSKHWRRKYRDCESMKTGTELVKQRLNISKVLSPFEVLPDSSMASSACTKGVIGLKVVSWEVCDEMIWSLSRQLSFVTEQQLEAAIATDFPGSLQGTQQYAVRCCSRSCLYLDDITPTPIIPIPKSLLGKAHKRSCCHLQDATRSHTHNTSPLSKVMNSNCFDSSHESGSTVPERCAPPRIPAVASSSCITSSLMMLLQQQQALLQMQQQQASMLFSLLRQLQPSLDASESLQFTQENVFSRSFMPLSSGSSSAFASIPLMRSEGFGIVRENDFAPADSSHSGTSPTDVSQLNTKYQQHAGRAAEAQPSQHQNRQLQQQHRRRHQHQHQEQHQEQHQHRHHHQQQEQQQQQPQQQKQQQLLQLQQQQKRQQEQKHQQQKRQQEQKHEQQKRQQEQQLQQQQQQQQQHQNHHLLYHHQQQQQQMMLHHQHLNQLQYETQRHFFTHSMHGFYDGQHQQGLQQ